MTMEVDETSLSFVGKVLEGLCPEGYEAYL